MHTSELKGMSLNFLSNSQPNYGFNLNKAVSSLLKKSNEAKGQTMNLLWRVSVIRHLKTIPNTA